MSTQVFPDTKNRDGDEHLVITLKRQLEELLMDVTSYLNADAATFFLYDVQTQEFDLPICHGLIDPSTFADPSKCPHTYGDAGRIVRERRAIIVENVSDHPDLDGPFARREKITSCAGYPVEHKEMVLGVLFVNYRNAHHILNETDKEKLEDMTQRIGATIAKYDIHEVLRKKRYRRESQEDQSLLAILSLARNVLKMPAAIWFHEPQRQGLFVKASRGLPRPFDQEAFVASGGMNVISNVFKTGIPQSVKDMRMIGGVFPFPEEAKKADWASTLCYPISFRRETYGVLEIFTFKPHEFTQQEHDTVRRLAQLAGVNAEHTTNRLESERLTEVSHTLSEAPDFERAKELIVEYARKFTGADSSSILLIEEAMDEEGKRIIVGKRSPKDSLGSVTPRSQGGVTEYIITTGKSLKVDDTNEDRWVNSNLVHEGIRSFIGVPVQMEKGRIGVLFVDGCRAGQFGQHDVRILENLAKEASGALGWTRLFLNPSNQIEKATANLSRLEDTLKSICEEIEGDPQSNFEFSAIQLIRPEENVIETVYGSQIAKKWTGLARHYLAKGQDIQADIALSYKTEIIQGWDDRFDFGLYQEQGHADLVRVFTPLMLVRNKGSNRYVQDWVNKCTWKSKYKRQDAVGHCVEMIPEFPVDFTDEGGRPLIEVIGTVEAGRTSRFGMIESDEVKRLIQLIARKVLDIRRVLPIHVLDTIVEHARQIVHADSASLHFPYDPTPGRYVYFATAGSGPLGFNFLDANPPRPTGLGRKACEAGKPKFVSIQEGEDNKEAIEDLNKEMYAMGVRAKAAFPFNLEGQEGVLYLHFVRPRNLTANEVGWVKLFVNRAIAAIRHAMTYAKMRDRTRQLSTIHALGQILAEVPEAQNLLYKIAWTTLNLFAADVVTIFEYFEGGIKYSGPQQKAGRLRDQGKRPVRQDKEYIPTRLAQHNNNIFVNDVHASDILMNPEHKRPSSDPHSFIQREKVKSAAGILLKVGTEIVGMMFINYRRYHEFSDEEKQVIETLASSAAITIKNRRFLGALNIGHQALISNENLSEFLILICKQAVEITGGNFAEIQFLNPENKMLKRQVQYPSEITIFPDRFNLPLGERFTDIAALNSFAPDIEYSANSTLIRSKLCVPLLDERDRILGVLTLCSYDKKWFSDTRSWSMKALAREAVLGIQKVREMEERRKAEALAAMNEFGANFAHRVSNLLGTISPNFYEVKKVVDKGDWDLVSDCLEDLKFDVEKLQLVMKAAQALKKFKDGKSKALQINDVIHKLVKESARPSNIDLKLTLDCKLPNIRINQLSLEYMFSNLIDNAIENMPDGGILSINSYLSSDVQWIVIMIDDTGPGIPEETRARIFEPFYTTNPESLGLGLWLVKQAFNETKGEIRISEKSGPGTRFTLKFPVN
ncbi:MAG: hypothetical protein NPIRA05_01920 [Nitrospirales bacterium]|nr:MAG: hypothetical protein NPIRA05_01920 [Nitrospirales bacterium]